MESKVTVRKVRGSSNTKRSWEESWRDPGPKLLCQHCGGSESNKKGSGGSYPEVQVDNRSLAKSYGLSRVSDPIIGRIQFPWIPELDIFTSLISRPQWLLASAGASWMFGHHFPAKFPQQLHPCPANHCDSPPHLRYLGIWYIRPGMLQSMGSQRVGHD